MNPRHAIIRLPAHITVLLGCALLRHTHLVDTHTPLDTQPPTLPILMPEKATLTSELMCLHALKHDAEYKKKWRQIHGAHIKYSVFYSLMDVTELFYFLNDIIKVIIFE